jgi:hypothetical protein
MVDVYIASFIFPVVRNVSDPSQKEFSMSLKAANTVNMTSMCCLRHAVGNAVSSVVGRPALVLVLGLQPIDPWQS